MQTKPTIELVITQAPDCMGHPNVWAQRGNLIACGMVRSVNPSQAEIDAAKVAALKALDAGGSMELVDGKWIPALCPTCNTRQCMCGY